MSEFPKKQTDLVNTIGIIAIGLVGAVGVYVSFIALQAFYNAEATALQDKRAAQGKSDEVRSLLAEQEATLNGYRWVSTDKQTVTLPIDRAMELVVADARGGKGSMLVPAAGPSVVPTVPAVYGRPPDGVVLPAQPAPAAVAPADGAAVAPADGAAVAPVDGAAAGAAPAGAAQPAPAQPAAPQPAGAAPQPAGAAGAVRPPAAAPAAGGTPAAR